MSETVLTRREESVTAAACYMITFHYSNESDQVLFIVTGGYAGLGAELT